MNIELPQGTKRTGEIIGLFFYSMFVGIMIGGILAIIPMIIYGGIWCLITCNEFWNDYVCKYNTGGTIIMIICILITSIGLWCHFCGWVSFTVN